MSATNKTYVINNPYFLADKFIFRKHKGLGSKWVKINHVNKIEEIGVDFPTRFHNVPLEDIIADKHCKEATRLEKSILNRVDNEYFYGIKNRKELEKRFGV